MYKTVGRRQDVVTFSPAAMLTSHRKMSKRDKHGSSPLRFRCLGCRQTADLNDDTSCQCQRCYMAWYCSAECAARDWQSPTSEGGSGSSHRHWCSAVARPAFVWRTFDEEDEEEEEEGEEGEDQRIGAKTGAKRKRDGEGQKDDDKGGEPEECRRWNAYLAARTKGVPFKEEEEEKEQQQQLEAAEEEEGEAEQRPAKRRRLRRGPTADVTTDREAMGLADMLTELHNASTEEGSGEVNFIKLMLRTTPPDKMLNWLLRAKAVVRPRAGIPLFNTVESFPRTFRTMLESSYGSVMDRLQDSFLLGAELKQRLRRMPVQMRALLDDLPLQPATYFYKMLVEVDAQAANPKKRHETFKQHVSTLTQSHWYELADALGTEDMALPTEAALANAKNEAKSVDTVVRSWVFEMLAFRMVAPDQLHRAPKLNFTPNLVSDLEQQLDLSAAKAATFQNSLRLLGLPQLMATVQQLVTGRTLLYQLLMLYTNLFHTEGEPFFEAIKSLATKGGGVRPALYHFLTRFMHPRYVLDWLRAHDNLDLFTPGGKVKGTNLRHSGRKQAEILWTGLSGAYYFVANVQDDIRLNLYKVTSLQHGMLPVVVASVYTPAALNLQALPSDYTVMNRFLPTPSRKKEYAEMIKKSQELGIARLRYRNDPPTNPKKKAKRCAELLKEHQEQYAEQREARERRLVWLNALLTAIDHFASRDRLQGPTDSAEAADPALFWCYFRRAHDRRIGAPDDWTPGQHRDGQPEPIPLPARTPVFVQDMKSGGSSSSRSSDNRSESSVEHETTEAMNKAFRQQIEALQRGEHRPCIDPQGQQVDLSAEADDVPPPAALAPPPVPSIGGGSDGDDDDDMMDVDVFGPGGLDEDEDEDEDEAEGAAAAAPSQFTPFQRRSPTPSLSQSQPSRSRGRRAPTRVTRGSEVPEDLGPVSRDVRALENVSNISSIAALKLLRDDEDLGFAMETIQAFYDRWAPYMRTEQMPASTGFSPPMQWFVGRRYNGTILRLRDQIRVMLEEAGFTGEKETLQLVIWYNVENGAFTATVVPEPYTWRDADNPNPDDMIRVWPFPKAERISFD